FCFFSIEIGICVTRFSLAAWLQIAFPPKHAHKYSSASFDCANGFSSVTKYDSLFGDQTK
ncbi:MAG: hypothetical protein MUO43_10175, partial [Desulfobacterales bacterium]|nr:hypothetical protein [Desulfobacterales bacterium]